MNEHSHKEFLVLIFWGVGCALNLVGISFRFRLLSQQSIHLGWGLEPVNLPQICSYLGANRDCVPAYLLFDWQVIWLTDYLIDRWYRGVCSNGRGDRSPVSFAAEDRRRIQHGRKHHHEVPRGVTKEPEEVHWSRFLLPRLRHPRVSDSTVTDGLERWLCKEESLGSILLLS